MKPLELTIFPKDPSYEPSDAFTVYLLGDGKRECAGTSCALPAKKRLTDAELAAEWQYQDNRCGQVVEGYAVAHGGTDMGAEEDEIEKLRIAYRFATLPHYDEEPTP